jgi:uncharacterized protein
MRTDIVKLLGLVKPQFRLHIDHGWHGIAHWSRVWYNARFLCGELGLPTRVPLHFAYLHDSQRFDEGPDRMHGHRACEWLDQLRHRGELTLPNDEYGLLVTAIAGHSHGETDAHPIVQVCWDSDRLDLGRVGIRPDPLYLCTAPAKRDDVIERAWRRSIGRPQWSSTSSPSFF